MGRLNYALIKSKYDAKGKDKVRLTQSALILTKPISSTASNYSFDILDSQTTTLQGNEIRLNQNDEFIATHLGVYLQGDFANGATKLFSYAPFELSGVEAAKVNALFDGFLKISVNNVVFVDKWDTRKHEVVNEMQFTPFVASTAAIGSTPARLPKFSSIKDGMYALEPLITLSGAKKNAIELTLPSAMTAAASFSFNNDAAAASTFTINRIAVVLRGLNAQNGATFQG